MDEEANKQTMVLVVLANGQVVGPVPLVARDDFGIIVQTSVAMKLKSGKAVERDVLRFVPNSSLLWMDVLPEEETTDDGGTTS